MATEPITFQPDAFFCVGDAEANFVYSGELDISLTDLLAMGSRIEMVVPDSLCIQDVGGDDGEMMSEWDYVVVKTGHGPQIFRVKSAGKRGEVVELQRLRTNILPVVTDVDDLEEMELLVELYRDIEA